MKKRRNQKTHISKPADSTPYYQALGWLSQPVILNKTIQQYENLVAYLFSIACVCFVIFYIVTGYVKRPEILDDQIINKIVKPSVSIKQLQSTYKNINPTHVLFLSEYTKLIQEDSQTTGFFFQSNKEQYPGLLIPMQYVTIPPNLDQISVSFTLRYKGEPTLKWGFQTKSNILGETGVVDLQLSPNDDFSKIIQSPFYYQSKSKFSVSWEEADYFVILVDSLVDTQTIIREITILGR